MFLFCSIGSIPKDSLDGAPTGVGCPGCGDRFDMRDPGQVLAHVYDQEIEIGEGGSRLLELRWYSPAIPLWSLSAK